MLNPLRTAMLVLLATLYVAVIGLVSRASFPLPEDSCMPSDMECWQQFEDISMHQREMQQLFSMLLSVAIILIVLFSGLDRDVKASLLAGSAITIIISSSVRRMAWLGAVFGVATFVAILWFVSSKWNGKTK